MKEYLIIDGYNVINAWPELRQISTKDLDSARNKLIDMMAEYQTFKGINIIIVFDAYMVKKSREKNQKLMGVEIVFTKEKESADGYIERRIMDLTKRSRVVVATNDRLEQQIVLGGGATRVSVRELILDYQQAKTNIRKKTNDKIHVKDELSSRIDLEILEKLEKFRRKL